MPVCFFFSILLVTTTNFLTDSSQRETIIKLQQDLVAKSIC